MGGQGVAKSLDREGRGPGPARAAVGVSLLGAVLAVPLVWHADRAGAEPEAAGAGAAEAPADPVLDLRALPATAGEYPLPEVVAAVSGHRVLDWSGEERAALEAAARGAVASINRAGVSAPRVNELGNAVEKHVRAALEAAGFAAAVPRRRSGGRQGSGYPDLEASRGGHAFYIEVKTYHPDNSASRQRSFYLSPSPDPKVNRDAFHLALAFALVPGDDGTYRVRSARWLDLHGLVVRLKLEFNASNHDLYGAATGLEFFVEPAP